MSLSGKLEADIKIKASAKDFHDVMSCRPHHLPNATPSHIQGCEIHEGEFGKEGTVLLWNYFHDGVAKVAKEKIVAIDDVNNSTTYEVIEGDITKEFKSCKFTIQATPKGEGSIVHWTLEYEKLNEDVPEPNSLLQFCVNITKDIDSHLTKS